MYTFADVNETSSQDYPAEAMMINDIYIEDQISGYRTLHVSGRETLVSEVDSYETGIHNGATFKGRRFPTRTITVTFQLIAESNSAYREAFNKLNAILDAEEAEIIFNDEPDKFFIGTPSVAGEIEPGRNSVIGEFEIACLDPFKYSVAQYTASKSEDTENTFLINYNGTQPSYPVIEAVFPETDDGDGTITGGESGFIAFFDEDGHILQCGDPEETDTEEYAESQTIFNQSFTSWSNAVAEVWKSNTDGMTPYSDWVGAGSVGIISSGDAVGVQSYGSGSGFHGPTITHSVLQDSGTVGATDWRLNYRQRLCTSANEQKGGFYALVWDTESNVIVAGVIIYKMGTGGSGAIRYIVNGKDVKENSIDLSYYNTNFGYEHTWQTTTTYTYYTKTKKKKKGKKTKWVKTAHTVTEVTGTYHTVPVYDSSVVKNGDTVTFKIGDQASCSFTNSEIADLKGCAVTFGLMQYGSNAGFGNTHIYKASFVADNCESFVDIPNKFKPGDILRLECESGDIYLNNQLTPELGALGNEWEAFCLNEGANQISYASSDWDGASVPEVNIYYREAYL